ncbi:hypothetical protein VQ7734_03641 [Vibrio quintilis]|uniref:Uncharacterized protein n=2 Tax=Vibrio quintilis TaxID=1117707 RepID=A0A1M7YYZ9_9VIBR|nr:hypothetical protein VQ7734_03641 [Vibrio quintilis]
MNIKFDIIPQKTPGTHGRMVSKTVFDVVELIPHPKDPSYKTNGPVRFSGSRDACEKWIKEHQ